MRTEKEVREILERTFLYDGHNAYFTYNDFGSIAYGAIYPDDKAWSERFLDTFERLLSEESPNGAFCDAVVDGISVYVDDGKEYLLHERYLPDHGIELRDGEAIPPDVMEAFKEEYRDDIKRYEETLHLLKNNQANGCHELTPALLIDEMQRFGTLPMAKELASCYPEIHSTLNAKSGIGFTFDFLGKTRQVVLVRGSYMDGTLAVTACISDPEDESFGQPWSSITVNLSSPAQRGSTVFLDTNNMGEAMLSKIAQLGAFTGEFKRSGFCSYPVFTFDAEVMGNMRNMEEFATADHWSLPDVRNTCHAARENVYDLSAESRDMTSGSEAIAGEPKAREEPTVTRTEGVK